MKNSFNEMVAPQKLPLLLMRPPSCVEIAQHSSDIGHNCHMYTFGIESSCFTEEEWLGRFTTGSTNHYTFQSLIMQGCISILKDEKDTPDLILYLNNQSNTKIADMEVLHSARVQGHRCVSRMSFCDKPKIYSHEIGAVQSEYSPEHSYLPQYSKFVYVVSCKLTNDTDLLIQTLKNCSHA